MISLHQQRPISGYAFEDIALFQLRAADDTDLTVGGDEFGRRFLTRLAERIGLRLAACLGYR